MFIHISEPLNSNFLIDKFFVRFVWFCLCKLVVFKIKFVNLCSVFFFFLN
ncbi:unnamed protein product [Arabidopsis halleri]